MHKENGSSVYMSEGEQITRFRTLWKNMNRHELLGTPRVFKRLLMVLFRSRIQTVQNEVPPETHLDRSADDAEHVYLCRG